MKPTPTTPRQESCLGEKAFDRSLFFFLASLAVGSVFFFVIKVLPVTRTWFTALLLLFILTLLWVRAIVALVRARHEPSAKPLIISSILLLLGPTWVFFIVPLTEILRALLLFLGIKAP